MDGFQTSRVLVLDDTFSDAAAIMAPLARLGVAFVYHNGEFASGKTTKLEGVRLLFVDMVLTNLSASPLHEKECAGITTGVLEQVVTDGDYPAIVVCWTSHADQESLINEFITAFRKAFPRIKVAEFLKFDKKELLDNADQLLEKVSDAINRFSPLTLLFKWEQLVHDAANRTTVELSRLMFDTEGSSNLNSQKAYTVFASLVLAERGTRILKESGKACLNALFLSINPLLLDSLDHVSPKELSDVDECFDKLLAATKAEVKQWNSASKAKSDVRKNTSVIEWMKKNPTKLSDPDIQNILEQRCAAEVGDSLLSEQNRGKLNKILHLAPHNNQKKIVTPGNLYLWHNKQLGLGGEVDGLEWIDWRQVFAKTFPDEKSRPTTAIPGLIEITPSCDFAQSKAAVSRLIVCYLVPKSEEKGIQENTAYLWKMGPFYIEENNMGLNGNYFLVANVRYFISTPMDRMSGWPLFCRIRQNTLVHLISFVAGHVNRVGLMTIEP